MSMPIDIMDFPASPDLKYLESLLSKDCFVLKEKIKPYASYPKAFPGTTENHLGCLPLASLTPDQNNDTQASSWHLCPFNNDSTRFLTCSNNPPAPLLPWHGLTPRRCLAAASEESVFQNIGSHISACIRITWGAC